MTLLPSHTARLEKLGAYRRDLVEERAALIVDGCPGTSWHEADELAWRKWPGERHWTYVDGSKTHRRRSKQSQPGECFRQAGWAECGTSAQGLTILERLP